MNWYLLFLIYFFLNLIIYSSCIIIFPFEIINPIYELSSNNVDLMSYLFNLSLYSNISVGNPPQQIKSFIRFDKSGFNIPSQAYNHHNSHTYKEIDENRLINDGIEYNGSFSSDEINLIEVNFSDLSQIIKLKDFLEVINDGKYIKNYKNISFINRLTDEIGFKNFGYIGLQFPDKDKFSIINFIPLFKNEKIIKKDSWTLLFETNKDGLQYNRNYFIIDDFNKIKGKLILGDNLHNYYSDKFMSNMSYSINMFNRNGLLNWDIQFDSIYVNDFRLLIDTFSEIRPDSVLNFGTLTFKLSIDIRFFDKLLKNSICQSKNMTLFPNIFYYVCDDSIKGENNTSFNIENFPNITFKHKNLGENFILTYKDVFIQDTNKNNLFYFLFAFDRNRIFNFENDRFILGIKFCEKYQFEFDNDNKLITHYVKIGKINDESDGQENIDNQEKKDNKIYLYIILIFLFGILLFILGMLFQKKIIKLPRKIRANELDDDDYEYKAKNEEANEKNVIGIIE